MIMKIINKFKKRNKGYTLVFAVLISSLVLSVGISILTISKKEYLLTAAARESTTAFYAADSGLECAVYHDKTGDKFSTSSPNLGAVSCNGFTPSIVTTSGGTYSFYTRRFSMRSDIYATSTCSVISVRKEYYNDPVAGLVPMTTIESRGYNTGWNNTTLTCDVAHPMRVERVLNYIY